MFLRAGAPDLTARLGAGYLPPTQRPLLEIEPGGFTGQVRVAVVYVNQDGLGVAFLESEPALCDYLQQFVRQDPAARAQPAPIQIEGARRKVLERLANLTTGHLEARFERFLTISDEALISAANRSSESREQAELFFAINSLEKHGQRIKREFSNRVAAGFNHMSAQQLPSRQREEGLEQTLRLVEKDDFDDWLLLNGLTHRLDSRVTSSCQKLDLVLSRMLHRPVTNETNPASPISLLVQLQETIAAEQIPQTVKPILYAAFSNTMFGDILQLYGQIHRFLQQQGIERAGSDQVSAGSLTQQTGAPRAEGIQISVPTMMSESPVQTSASAPVMGSNAATPVPITRGWSVIQQLETLLQTGMHGSQAQTQSTPTTEDAGERLLASVKQDELLPAATRELLERLEAPFIKTLVNNLARLEDEDADGRRFFQALQGLAPFFSTDLKSQRRGGRVSQDLKRLFARIERGELTGISQVTEQMEQLQERQRELFERNRKLAIESFKRNENLREVHRQVKSSLRKILLGESVSVVLDKLFRYGWANLLIQTAMLHGTGSAEWKTYLRVVEVLHRLFRSRRTHDVLSEAHKRDLLQIVKRGFIEYPVHPEGSEQFVLDLQRALDDPQVADTFIDQRIKIDEHYLVGLFLGQLGLAEDRVVDPPAEAHWLEQVKRLDAGTWLIQHHRPGESRMVNLARMADDTNRYLLIDGNGLKVMEADADQLAQQFADKTLVQPQDANLSVLDRALRRMLGNTYEKVEQQVSHDELTGLMNRRAFERRLNELLSAQIAGITHILIMLDVDQFGLVNDLCGFEGGDKLLQAITHLLHNYLPPDALLARTGDDEFSILMLQNNLDQGFQIAETQRQSLDAFKYTWNNRSIPVSASLGVVEINGNTRTSGELLQAAAAACSIAKRTGRNCTRVYREDDKAFLEHQRLIKSAASIEDALARDRIMLMVQAITPVQDKGHTCHYEILLRVLDEDDKPQSPFHFIKAAERYDLMRSVDRWVVRRFFKMVDEHLDEMTKLGGFSLNLSGQSVADEDFRAFLKQQITRSPMPRERLGFEITETAMVKDSQEVVHFIEEIRALGCSFYLDDFGSGYASFAYLKDLPVDFIKIDGIFIKELLHDPTSQTMVKSVTEIAHLMQRRVVAEFVEDQATADLLREIGVDFIQGYHIGRPLPLHEILAISASPTKASQQRIQSSS